MNFKKIIFLNFTLLLLFIFFELLLNAYFSSSKSYPEGKLKYRILILGESTSSPYYEESEEDNSWPSLLEKKFIDQGFSNIEVVNISSPGIITPVLIKKIDELEGHVDLVIAMTGVNDFSSLSYKKNKKFLNYFKTYHLVKRFIWIMKNKYNERAYTKLNNVDFRAVHISEVQNFVAEYEKGKVINFFEKREKDDFESSSVVVKTLEVLIFKGYSDLYIRKHLNTLIGEYPGNDQLMFLLLEYLYISKNSNECLRIGEKFIEELSFRNINQVLKCAGYKKRNLSSTVVEHLHKLDFNFDLEEEKIGILKSRKDIAEYFKATQTKVLFVDYPHQKEARIKNVNQNVDYLPPIEWNRFEKEFGIEVLYSDLFKIRWGHFSKVGHRIQSEHIYKYIKNDILKNCVNKRCNSRMTGKKKQ